MAMEESPPDFPTGDPVVVTSFQSFVPQTLWYPWPDLFSCIENSYNESEWSAPTIEVSSIDTSEYDQLWPMMDVVECSPEQESLHSSASILPLSPVQPLDTAPMGGCQPPASVSSCHQILLHLTELTPYFLLPGPCDLRGRYPARRGIRGNI